MNEENKALIQFLKERVVGYRARGFIRAVAALERVLPVIEAANWPISSGEEALLLPGVGKFVKHEIEQGLREIAASQLLAASATASPLPFPPSLPLPSVSSSTSSTSTSPFASQVKQERATPVLDLTLEEDEEEEAAPTVHNERAPSPPASTPPRSSSFTPSLSITPPSPSSQSTPSVSPSSTLIQPQLISQVSVEQWLQLTVGLPQYLPNFIKSGYDRIDAICCIESEPDLERIGIILPGHQKLLLRHIRALSSEPSSTGTPLSAIATPPQPLPTRLITSSPSASPSVSSYAAVSSLPPLSSSTEPTAFATPPRRNGDPKSPRRGSSPSSATTRITVKPKTEVHSCPPTLGRTTSSTSVAETADPRSPSIAATGATNQRASTSAARTLIFTDEETSEFQPRTIRGCLETPTFVGDLGSLTASGFGTAAASPSFGGLAIGTGDSPNPVMLPQYLHLHCDVDSLNRGLAYYIVGAIQNKWEGPDKTTVTVYGTGKQIYTVQLAWRDQLLKSSHCTCPAFAKSGSGLRHAIRGWCKHIVCGFLSCVYGPKKAPRALAAQYGHLVLSNVTPALLRRAGWKPEDLANLPSPPTSASTIASSPSGSPLPSYLTPSSGINGVLGAPVLPGPPSSTSPSSLASSASSPPPPTRKQNRSPRPYIPRYRSGPYAIMLAMYQALILKKGHQGRPLQLSEPDSMAKNEIIDLARPFTDSPWEREKGHCHDSRKWYTAWTSMDTVLVLKGLVIKSPDERYSLSPSGIALAAQLWQEGCSLDPSLHPPASSPTSASTATSPSLSSQSYSSSSPALTSLSSTLSSNISLNSPKNRTNSPSTSTSSSLLSRSTESISTEITSNKPDVLQRAYSLPTGLTPSSSSQYKTISSSRQPSQPEEREMTSGTINNETTAPIKAEEGEIDTDQLALRKALELSQQEALKLKQGEDEEEASLREALRLSLETSQASEFEWSVPQEENVEATQPFSLFPISTSKLQQQSITTTPMQLEEQETNMQLTNKETFSTMTTELETTLGQQSDEVIEDNTNQETTLTVMNDDTTGSQAKDKTEETSSKEKEEEEERLPENHQELEQHEQQPSQQTTEAVQQTVVDRQQQDYPPTAQTENLGQSHEVEEEEKAENDEEEEPAEPSPTYSTNVLPTNNNIPYSRVFNRVISGEEINKDFEVVLLVDTREPTEVRLPVLQCMHRAGLACEERALAAGDFLWIMREKDSYYEMERQQWGRGQESQNPFSVTTSHSLLSESETASSPWNGETQSQELPATTNRRRGRPRKRRSGGTEEWKEVKKEELVLDWIIERKSVTDLASSMESGRFSEQQERLLRSKMNVVTLVEGINANHCLLTEELFESVCDCLRFHRPNLFFVHTNTTDDTVLYLKTMTEEITHFYRRWGVSCSSPLPSSSLSNTFQLESGCSQPPSQLLQNNGETEDEADAEEEAMNNCNSEDSNKNNEDTGRSNYNGRKRKSNCNNNRRGEKRKKSTSSPAIVPLYELEEELPARWMLFDEFNSRLKKGSDSISYTWKQQLMQIHGCSESTMAFALEALNIRDLEQSESHRETVPNAVFSCCCL
ncbi:Crossover junction endonuclease mus81 [Balamuthia mandrillaris]